MNVRLGTACGFNLVYVTHWTYEEIPIVPPEPPITLAADAESRRLAREGSVAQHAEAEATTDAPPEPALRSEPPPPELAKTLTLYMNGEVTPLVLNDAEAAAVLGVLVSQSGSLT